jgi:hypothetical protein
MSISAIEDAIPYWTDKMYLPGGGQDHLGLGSVITNRILPRLSPSINVLTVHPRYWSFYAFVLSEFWTRDLPRTKSALRAWYRPLECMYSVACHLCTNPDHRGSAIGSQKLGGIVARDPDTYDPEFDYVQSPMGGYGLYYATVMEAAGLVVRANPQLKIPIDAVTPTGQLLAQAFRSTIEHSEYYTQWLETHHAPIPSHVLAEYGELACFCRLRKSNPPDRVLLEDVFLHSGRENEASDRRETLRFFCELAAQTSVSPVSSWSFRRLVYFRSDYDENQDVIATFVPTPPTLRAARRWRLYQLREYYNFALNEIWRRLADWGLALDGDAYPIPVGEVLASLESIDFGQFAHRLEISAPPLTAESPMADLIEWVMRDGEVTNSIDDAWNLTAALTEDRLVHWLGYGAGEAGNGPDALAGAIALLSLVASRLWAPEIALVQPEDWFPVVDGGVDRLGLQRFLTSLRKKTSDGETIREVTRWLTLDYVMAQHERVAAAKLSTTGDTFRFRREAGRVRFFNKGTRFTMNDSRFNALATIIYELGWSGYLYDDKHPLTSIGKKIRTQGDLSTTGLLWNDAEVPA